MVQISMQRAYFGLVMQNHLRPQDNPSLFERVAYYEREVARDDWDPNTWNIVGYTPLVDLIAYDGDIGLFKKVLAHPRCDANVGSPDEGFTPLIMASSKKGKEGNPVYLDALLSCGKELDHSKRDLLWNMTAADHEKHEDPEN